MSNYSFKFFGYGEQRPRISFELGNFIRAFRWPRVHRASNYIMMTLTAEHGPGLDEPTPDQPMPQTNESFAQPAAQIEAVDSPKIEEETLEPWANADYIDSLHSDINNIHEEAKLRAQEGPNTHEYELPA